MEAIDLFVQPKPLLSSTIERIAKTGELRCKQRTLARNDYLFREGDDIHSTFYIQRGMVRLYSDTHDGYSKTVFFHKAGTLIGFQGLPTYRGPQAVHPERASHHNGGSA